jgi:drug/metabolite transporter (DMT)-like permease
VVVGFVGVLIVVHPFASGFQAAALYSVGAAFCNAGYALTTRMLAPTESAAGMLLYSSAVAAVALTPTLPTVWITPTDPQALAALMVSGLCGAIGHWYIILASRRAPATVLAPFSYLQLLPAALLGYVLFSNVPDVTTLIGAVVIVASGLYIVYRERVRRGA